MSFWLKIIPLFRICIVVMVTSCGREKTDVTKLVNEELPEVVDFNFHVRPILSDKCFACHGPDAENQKAGLRLDRAEDAYKALESGNGYAIVPKRPRKSEAYLRIITDDADLLMPPPESHLQLSDREIALIEKWITQGAEYKPHWAFVPPAKEQLPKVKKDDWIKQPIDRFVLSKLEKKEMKPSEVASKETLIRRVTFDLTGLPPTLKEIDDFIQDESLDAYEKLVDRLLQSAAYGERMAADWMDVARYADSDGYLDDKHRAFHPWRDWVISAFNRNMPYDQFITWQLAGDLLPDANKESVLATAFNRLHKKNSEAGIVFEEYRVEYVADRTNTLGKGIMGISMECARCHDHKYDPISQKEYYQLFGFFNSTFEIGTPVYGPDQVPGPSLLLSTELEDAKIDEIKAMIEELEMDSQKKPTTDDGFEAWLATLNNDSALKESIEQSTTAHHAFDEVTSKKVNGKEKITSPNEKNKELPAMLREPILKKGVKGNAFYVSDYNRVKLGNKIGWYDRIDDFSFQLYVKPDTIYGEVGLLWHSEGLRIGRKGYSLHLKDNRVQFMMSKTWPQNALQVTTKTAIAPKKWTQLTVTYDGSSEANGVSIYLDGEKQAIEVDYDNLYKSILYVNNIHTYGFQGIELGATNKALPFKKGGLDEVKVFDRQLSALEVLHSYNPDEVKEIISNKVARPAILREHYYLVLDRERDTIKQKLKKAREQENELISNIEEIMVMGDLPEPRPTFVLSRGAYDAPAEEVEPSTPNAILPFDESYPRNRYGLTQWLFDEKNPLTSRVYVNRIWQMHFGKGIVSTSDDLGSQGSLPSHPELLDWLALYFMENDWNIKALHKLIVTSATYMQDSKVTEESLKKDPENILLSRGPRYRMPAEMIRDNALAVSGLLVQKQGGESVYPYQPDGLWKGLTTKKWAYKYLLDEGEGLHRRSIYTIWKRQAPPPFMQIFDVSDRGSCEVSRRPSSTPLQALNLLNDPQFVEASRVLAENLIKTESESSKRLKKAFRLLTGRTPDSTEQKILTDFYEEEHAQFEANPSKAIAFISNGKYEWNQDLNPSEVAALGIIVNSIMNTSEAYTKK